MQLEGASALPALRLVEPATGFEPATRCLQNSRSTSELRRRLGVRSLHAPASGSAIPAEGLTGISNPRGYARRLRVRTRRALPSAS